VATATPDEPALAPSYDHLPRREVAALVARSLVACLAPPRRSPPAPRTAPASPRVTILIPTYDWSQVLPFAIRSALAQSEGDFELIVVGDDTASEGKAFAKKYPFAVVRDAMPDKIGDFSKKEKRAKLLYVKSQYGHMEMVTNGKVIPLLLRLTPLAAL